MLRRRMGLERAQLQSATVPAGGTVSPDVRSSGIDGHRTRSADSFGAASLGSLPLLAVTMALGSLTVAVANVGAADEVAWAEPAYWIGLLVIVMPVTVRLIGATAARTERILLLVLMGLALFLCEYISSPLRAATFDEFLHIRTAQDIVVTGHLFTPNHLLPVSPFYPGLEIATTAFAQLSGLDVTGSGTILLGLGRVLLILSLFLFYEQVTASSRFAGLGVLIYTANPRFLYFDAQYAYESLALPLAALVIFGVASRIAAPDGSSTQTTGPPLAVFLLLVVAVVVTHHVTSLALLGFLVLWAILRFVSRRRLVRGPGVGTIAIFTAVALAGWAVLVAPGIFRYLVPAVGGAAEQVLGLLVNGRSGRELFVSTAGEIAPAWERLVGFAAIGLLLIASAIGLRESWRQGRSRPGVLALSLAALVYPLTLLARLTELGQTVAARTPEFLFLGLGHIVAAGVLAVVASGSVRRARRATVAVSVAAGVIFLGGVIVGTPQWARLPGPYLVSADSRSVEANGIAAAKWASEELGRGHRLIADRVNQLLMSTYGQQQVLTAYADQINLIRFYEPPAFGPNDRALVRTEGIELVVVDERLTTQLPMVGFYFQRSEITVPPRVTPLALSSIRKFDTQGVDRIFDDGAIRVYDVTALGDGQ